MIFQLRARGNFHSIESISDQGHNFDYSVFKENSSSFNFKFRDPIHRRSIGDMTYWLHLPVFSSEAVKSLEITLSHCGELSQLNCEGHTFYAFQPNTIDFFDKDSSEILYFNSGGKIMSIEKHAFFADKVPNTPSIFKIEGYPINTYVNEAFATLAFKNNLRGFKFTSVWPDNTKRVFGQQQCESFSELFERDANKSLEDDFDSEAWRLTCSKISSINDIETLPLPVKAYYASRYLQWDVGNGGFAQAVMNALELFDLAAFGYREINKPKCSELILKAKKMAHKEMPAILAASATLESAFNYFKEGRFSKFDSMLNKIDWWSDFDRVEYIKKNKPDFLSLDQ